MVDVQDVRRALRARPRRLHRQLRPGQERGASAFVTLDGAPVVDIWAGDADDDGTPWERDTIVNVYSTTKTMAPLCVLMLADRGEVDLHAPVATSGPSSRPTARRACSSPT